MRGEQSEIVPAVPKRARPSARVDGGPVREEEDAHRGSYPRSFRWTELLRPAMTSGRDVAPHPSLKRIKPAAS